MPSHETFIRRHVDAVDLVVGDVALQPLHVRPQVAKHGTRLLRCALQVGGCESAGARHVSLDDELGHEQLLHSATLYAESRGPRARQSVQLCRAAEGGLTAVTWRTGKPAAPAPEMQ